MALIPNPTAQNVVQASKQVKQHLIRHVEQSDKAMSAIRGIVGTHGRAAVAAELGADSADLLAIYTSLKNHLEIAEINRPQAALPS